MGEGGVNHFLESVVGRMSFLALLVRWLTQVR